MDDINIDWMSKNSCGKKIRPLEVIELTNKLCIAAMDSKGNKDKLKKEESDVQTFCYISEEMRL